MIEHESYARESNMIDALFGSKTRVKLLNLFLSHPGQSFYVREITRLIDEQINSVRRELSNMLEVGVITSDTAENKLYYQVNQDYEFYAPLRAIFANVPPQESASDEPKDEVNVTQISILSSVPALRLAIMSGALVKGSTSSIDLLLVGNLSPAKVKTVIDAMEKNQGQELHYALLTYDEFYYRLSVKDRFVTEILNAKHVVAVDKDNVLGE